MVSSWLRATKGSLEGSTVQLKERTVIGRGGDVDLQVLEKDVSRRHALLFRRDDGKMLLLDLDSTNGTWLDDQQVARAELHPEAVIRIGQSLFVYEERSADEEDSMPDAINVLSGPALDTTAKGAFQVEPLPDASATTFPDNPTLSTADLANPGAIRRPGTGPVKRASGGGNGEPPDSEPTS